MRTTNYIKTLINSGITLNAKETELVEAWIQCQAKPVKKSHLNDYKCLAALNSGKTISTTGY